jgi:hypothetical protein
MVPSPLSFDPAYALSEELRIRTNSNEKMKYREKGLAGQMK